MATIKQSCLLSPFKLQKENSIFVDRMIHVPLRPRCGFYMEFPGLTVKMGTQIRCEGMKWRACANFGKVNGVAHNLASKLLPGTPPFKNNSAGLYSDGCLPSEHKENNNNVSLPSQRKENDIVILLDKLKAIQLHLLSSEHWNTSYLKSCNRHYLPSATNLTHYLAMRSLDLKKLKIDLSTFGLVHLDSVNSHIFASISAAIQLLETLISNSTSKENRIFGHEFAQEAEMRYTSIIDMRKMALSRANMLFGTTAHHNCPHIMVTVGKEAISDDTHIPNILKAGANILRINCAHDDPDVWGEIIRSAREGSELLGKSCKILMDLAGPKLRTGSFIRDEHVIKVSPQKDANGDTILPAQLWLCCAEDTLPAFFWHQPDAVICIDRDFFHKLKVNDVLTFTDFRGRKRTLKVFLEYRHSSGSGYMVECQRTAYIGLGMKFCIKKKNKKDSVGLAVKIPAVDQFRLLKVGDLLILSKSSCLFVDNPSSSELGLTKLTCSSDELIDCVKPGDTIAFDDGKLWGRVEEKNTNEITVLITNASLEGSKLGTKKSINIPRSEKLPKGLTSKDLVDLEYVAAHADMVGISFVRDVDDIASIQHELKKRRLDTIGVILKIETREGFEKLPELLFQGMQSSNPVGVMVARGDLMVECGWDCLAEIQEEVVSICNAAHIPVIWATQVLESLIKFGYPTRAEITDISVAMKTSCVMLNKGIHIAEAVSALDSIFSNHSGNRDQTTLFMPLSQSSQVSK